MTSNLSTILEKWAQLYKPISHDPKRGSKDKAYYEIKTINQDSEFVRNQNTAKSPCMAYSVLVDAEMNSTKVVNYRHTVYFMSRAKTRSLAKNAKQDDELGTDQQLLMDDMVQDLIQYLRDLKHYGRCPITGETYDTPTMLSLRGLSLDKCEWGSLPVKYAEWHLMELSIDQDQPLPAIGCINKEKYHLPVSEETTVPDGSPSGETTVPEAPASGDNP